MLFLGSERLLCQDHPYSCFGWFLLILYSQGLCLRLLISDIIHSFHKTVYLKAENQRYNLLCYPTLAMLLTVTDTGDAKLLKHLFSWYTHSPIGDISNCRTRNRELFSAKDLGSMCPSCQKKKKKVPRVTYPLVNPNSLSYNPLGRKRIVLNSS